MKSRIISKKSTVVCDVCGAEIEIFREKLLTKKYADGIWIDYFKCQKCGMVYPYLFTDPSLRVLRNMRGFEHSSEFMKRRSDELKMRHIGRIKEL